MPSSPQQWYAVATSRWTDWPIDELLRIKNTTTISVVIPARDEGATIGPIVAGIAHDLVETSGLVDELIVIDSDSGDATAAIARENGAQVHRAREIRPDLGWHPGKGEALWKSQFVSSGDVLVFIDADLVGWGTHFVSGLLGPLLSQPSTLLVRGFYDRLLEDGSGRAAPQGGRVTELVARPLLNLWWPQLSRVVQPLAGEWAIRRQTFAGLSVPTGYGVELSTLLDVCTAAGLDAIAQVDLGSRAHSHQSVHDLGVMAAELMAVAATRRGLPQPPGDGQIWQFDRSAEPAWRGRTIPLVERPPARTSKGLTPCPTS